MSRIQKRFNIQAHLVEAVNARALANGLSKSEVVNRALATFFADLPSAVVTLLGNVPQTTAPVMAGYMLDSVLLARMDEQAGRLYLSREQFLRLALDYYLKYCEPLAEGA